MRHRTDWQKAVVLMIASLTIPGRLQQMTQAQLKGQLAKYWVYIGTARYTDAPSDNLYVCRFDSKTGQLMLEGVAAKTVNPGFVTVHPSKPYLYSVNEIGEFQGQKNGAVSSFQIDENSGRLNFLNQRPAFGANPSYVTVSKNGRFAIVASYYGGVASFPIEADGSLGRAVSSVRQTGVGVKAARPDGSHPHSVVLSPDNRFAIVADLGLDKLFVYKFDPSTGSLTPNHPGFSNAEPGSGPRHLVFAPNGQFVYVVHELQSTVSTYAYEPRSGVLHLLQTISTLPRDFHGSNTGAEVQIASSGRFVYVSNRGHDSIAVFRVNSKTGVLEPIQDVSTQGRTPRSFVLDPSGDFLLAANQDSNQIVLFRVDRRTGRISPTGGKVAISAPASIAFEAIP